jgi:drug/metabolite transporter (DMT)-like permease
VSSTSTRRGVLAAAAAALLFGINGTVSKLALETGLPSTRLVTIRSAGSAVCLLLVVLVTRPRNLAVDRRELGFLAVAGVVGIGVVQWFYFTAISRLPVGIALLLEYLAPVFVALWVRFGRGEPVRSSLWGALGLCLVGLALVAQVWNGRTLDGLGVLAGLAAAVSLAVYYLTGEHGLGRRDPVSLAAYTFTAAALFWMVVRPPWTFDWSVLGEDVALPGPFDDALVPLGALVAWNIVLGTVVPYLLVLVAIRHVGSTRTGLLGMAEPVTSGIVAWVVLSESLAPIQLAGGAVVLVGIVIAETARSAAPDEPHLLPLSEGPVA